MNLWLTIMVSASVLAGTGVGLLVSSVPDYLQLSATYRNTGEWLQGATHNIITCSNIGCAAYNEIEQRYQNLIAVDSAAVAAGIGIALFAWRKHARADKAA